MSKELTLLAHLPNLERVHGQQDIEMGSADFALARPLPFPSLKLKVTTREVSEMRRCLQMGLHPVLQTLTIGWLRSTNEVEEGHAASSLLEPLAAAVGLRSLQVSDSWDLSNRVAQKLASLTQLTRLGLDVVSIGPVDALRELSALTGLKGLYIEDERPAPEASRLVKPLATIMSGRMSGRIVVSAQSSADCRGFHTLQV
jgi:hypothetical protein